MLEEAPDTNKPVETSPDQPAESPGKPSIEEQLAALRGQIDQVQQIANLAKNDYELGMRPSDGGDGIPDEEWFESAAAWASGVAYVYGHKRTDDTGYKWAVVDLEAGTVTTTDSDPSFPFPANKEYYEISKVAGDIHIAVR